MGVGDTYQLGGNPQDFRVGDGNEYRVDVPEVAVPQDKSSGIDKDFKRVEERGGIKLRMEPWEGQTGNGFYADYSVWIGDQTNEIGLSNDKNVAEAKFGLLVKMAEELAKGTGTEEDRESVIEDYLRYIRVVPPTEKIKIPAEFIKERDDFLTHIEGKNFEQLKASIDRRGEKNRARAALGTRATAEDWKRNWEISKLDERRIHEFEVRLKGKNLAEVRASISRREELKSKRLSQGNEFSGDIDWELQQLRWKEEDLMHPREAK